MNQLSVDKPKSLNSGPAFELNINLKTNNNE